MNSNQIYSAACCLGQVSTYFVQPEETDSGYSAAEDSMAISIKPGAQLNKLYLFIGGTRSSSSEAYTGLRLHAASLGFDFVNLSYPNTVAAASLDNNNDSLAFNNYRQEICFGTPISDAVTVDSLNSIATRTLKLIQYLSTANPSENWGQYLATPNTIDWTKVVVGGHSQGAGHAAYLAKQFLVDRVLMFAGPNDYSTRFSNSANWLRIPGETPVKNHFAYLSLNDEVVDFSKQFINLSGLGLLEGRDSTYIDNLSPPYNDGRLLYTTQFLGVLVLDHSVPIRSNSKNREVWRHMLTSEITTRTFNIQPEFDLSVFPNPTTSNLHLESPERLTGKKYILRNFFGQTIRSGIITGLNRHVLDVAEMNAGVYFLSVGNQTVKVVKE